MKNQRLLFTIIIIYSVFTVSFQINDPLAIPNFDVREKFRNCYNDGYDTDYNEIPCLTNWPIQFSLILTDKNCIQRNMGNRLISSMNINSCMKLGDKINNCREISEYYKDFPSTTKVIEETIK